MYLCYDPLFKFKQNVSDENISAPKRRGIAKVALSMIIIFFIFHHLNKFHSLQVPLFKYFQPYFIFIFIYQHQMQSTTSGEQLVKLIVKEGSPFELISNKPDHQHFQLKKAQCLQSTKSQVKLYLSSNEKKDLLLTLRKNNSIAYQQKIFSCSNKPKLVVSGGQLILRGKFVKCEQNLPKKQKILLNIVQSSSSSDQHNKKKTKKQRKNDKKQEKNKEKKQQQKVLSSRKGQYSEAQEKSGKDQHQEQDQYQEQSQNECQEQQALTIRDKKERAIVSSKIIQMIKNENEQNSQALAKRIKQLTASDFGKLKQNNLNAVLQLFTKGVSLQPCFIKQSRIKDNQPINNFKFHPTWMGTGSIFKFIENQRNENSTQLIKGTPGIGKTASMILYSLLMENVFRYALVADKEKIAQRIKSKAIVSPLKVIYWSIDQSDDQNFIKDHFIQQCPEFMQYLKQKNQQNWQSLSIRKLVSQMKWYYYSELKIQVLIIFDQINLLASFCRKAIKKQRILQQANQQKSQLERQKQKLNRLKEIINSLNNLRQAIDSLGNYKIYNSSVNIERSLMGSNSKEYPYTLQIEKTHIRVRDFEINYENMVQKQKGLTEIQEYIKFQFRKRKLSFSKSKIKELLKNQNTCFLTPLKIYEIVLDVINLQKEKDQKKYCFNKFFQSVLDMFDNSVKQLYNKSHKFQQKNIQIYGQIFSLATYKLYNQAYSKFLLNRQKKIIIQPKQIIQNSKFDVENFINKGLFFKNDDRKYEFKYSNSLFQSLTVSNLVESYLHVVQFAFTEMHISKQSASVFGTVFEHCLLQCLRQCSIQDCVFQYQTHPNYETEIYRISRNGTFVQFNQREDQNYTDNMNNLLQLAANNPQQYIFGSPVNSNNTHSFTSFCVDFCIVKYQKQPNNFDVIFYDVKTGFKLDKGTKDKDTKQFKKRFGQVKYQNKRNKISQINTKFVILCNPMFLPNDRNKYNFVYGNIKKINLNWFKHPHKTKLGILMQKMEDIVTVQ